MPYRRVSELPSSVRGHIPVHAQEIYMNAFNSAWEQYADSRKRRSGASREETAHKVAWGAVERVYAKDAAGKWRLKRQSRS